MKDFARIIDEVAAETGIPFAAIMGRRQQAEIVAARYRAFYRLYHRIPDAKQQSIAAYFKRDHTSISHGIRREAERLAGLRT
jgi:chromosomal replication initiation ATPase DnaA